MAIGPHSINGCSAIVKGPAWFMEGMASWNTSMAHIRLKPLDESNILFWLNQKEVQLSEVSLSIRYGKGGKKSSNL